DKGDPFLYDDFTPEQIEDLKRPAVEAAESVQIVENQISINEQGRVQVENERETAELTRQSSESERNENEGLRVNAEIVREQQEQARQTNTATAITNAENAIVDVNTAKNDYYNVVKPDIIAQGEYAQAQGNFAKSEAERIRDLEVLAMTVRKTYQTEALALADKNPIDTITSLPLTVGQFVSIVDDGEKNGIYRIGSISGDGTMSLELQGKLGDLSDYANHGYESNPKTLKEVDDDLVQLKEDYGLSTVKIAEQMSASATDTTYWLQDKYISIVTEKAEDSGSYIASVPIVLIKGLHILKTHIGGNAGILLKDSDGYVRQLLSVSDSVDDEYYIYANDGDILQFSCVANSYRNVSLIRYDSKKLLTTGDYRLMEDEIRVLKALENKTVSELTRKGSEMLPLEILNSEYTDTDIWFEGFLDNGGIIRASASRYVNKKKIKLPKGEYHLVTYLIGNTRALIFKDGEIIQEIDSSLSLPFSTYLISIPEDGCELQFTAESSKHTPTQLSLKPLNDIVELYITSDIKEIHDKIENINNTIGYVEKGTNFINDKSAILEGITEGYLRITDGVFIDSTYYHITPSIQIPNGAKVSVEVQGNADSSINSLSLGVYVFKGDNYIGGFHSRTPQPYLEDIGGGLLRFTLPENLFAQNGDLSIRVSAGRGRIVYNTFKVYAYDDSNFLSSGGSGGSLASRIDIPTLSPSTAINIPHTVYNSSGVEDESVIGTPNSKTVLTIPISDAYNLRFKFRITEDILNTNKITTIFESAGLQVIASPEPMFQQTSTYIDDNEVEQTSYWPVLLGGVKFNSQNNSVYNKQNIGDFAFSVQYKGNIENEASIQNTGSAIILKVNGNVVSNLLFSNHSTMESLYQAIGAVTDFEVDYNELESRKPNELVIFPEVRLVSEYRSVTDGDYHTPNTEGEIYRDAAKLHIPYSIDRDWHQVEIVSLNSMTYMLIDGIMTKVAGLPLYGDNSELIFGGDCGVVFKDIEIDTMTSRDAEIVYYSEGRVEMVISSVNPLIIFWEGHGMTTTPSHEESLKGMSTTPDRLQTMFTLLREKGYQPVSLDEVRDWSYNGRELPKRCYTIFFDDYEFDNYLNLKKRSVFTRFNVKPNLCIISENIDNREIKFNNEIIEVKDAIEMGRRAGFNHISHTRNHRNVTKFKPSDYESEWLADVYSTDKIGLQPNVVAYPFGSLNKYVVNTLKWCGANMGIRVVTREPIRRNTNPFCYSRLELGLRESIETVISNII
ncbi:MAG TPA: polysaccharide deacetylase family protein, partial [Tissierellaceae bacterium]|nr:polysaccharide deacetylase family protein [Tissierellaceae bacterium]